jgi:hypothetical protein
VDLERTIRSAHIDTKGVYLPNQVMPAPTKQRSQHPLTAIGAAIAQNRRLESVAFEVAVNLPGASWHTWVEVKRIQMPSLRPTRTPRTMAFETYSSPRDDDVAAKELGGICIFKIAT